MRTIETVKAEKAKKQKNTYNGENPVIRKFAKVEERAGDGEVRATYKGIANKTLFFLLMTGVGFALYYYIAPMLAVGEPLPVDGYVFYLPQLFLLLGAALVTIITPFLACFINSAIPVAGTLYSLCQGIFISWLSYTFAGEYNDVIILAVLITLVLVFSMLMLYTTGTVRPNNKFTIVMTTLFLTMIISSVIIFISYFIPGLRGFVDLIIGNAFVSILISVLGVIIACLFLICDFDTIAKTVEHGLPKKYEWVASFGLAFTIIWLYLKVLDILIRIKDN